QADIDLEAEHERVEDESQKQLQREFQLVHHVEETLKGLAGEKWLDLFARGLLIEQLDLAAVLASETQHELAKAAITGALGEDPADHAHDIGSRLRGEHPNQIRKQELTDRDL